MRHSNVTNPLSVVPVSILTPGFGLLAGMEIGRIHNNTGIIIVWSDNPCITNSRLLDGLSFCYVIKR